MFAQANASHGTKDLPQKTITDFQCGTRLENGGTVSSVSPALQPLLRPRLRRYMISELAIDPAKEVRELALPMLIVSGGHDLQLGAADAALLAAARPDAVRLDISGMNHVLKLAPTEVAGQHDAYANPNIPLAEGLSDAIASFVSNRRMRP